jgi:hypothetical protein
MNITHEVYEKNLRLISDVSKIDEILDRFSAAQEDKMVVISACLGAMNNLEMLRGFLFAWLCCADIDTLRQARELEELYKK